MTSDSTHQTRLERILGVKLAEDAVRQWPQSGEVIDGRARIDEVESHFVGLKLGVGRRHVCGDTILVEWSTDYGDGRVYRNVTIAELRGEEAIRVTDYSGEPFTPPVGRGALATHLDMPRQGVWAGRRRPRAGLRRAVRVRVGDRCGLRRMAPEGASE